MDYCFLGKEDEDTQPIMVVRERDTKMTMSFLARQKGAADAYVINRTLAFLKELGHVGTKVIIKCDQESSIKAVADKVSGERIGQTIQEHSPVRSSGSNGIVERGVKEVEYQIRSMKDALDAKIGTNLGITSKVLPWMIEFASVLVNRYLVGHDGKTGYERLKGKQSKVLGFEFGEKVHFRRLPVPGRLAKLESLWKNGIFVGYKSNTGEYMVVNDEGAFKSRNVKRMPKEMRWDKAAIEAIRFTPWTVTDPSDGDRRSGAHTEHKPRVEIAIDKEIRLQEPLQEERESIPRRVYLTKSIIDKFGATDGCPGCITVMLGGTGIPHSEDCRKRIENEMRDDPEQRQKLKEVRKRREEFVKQHLGGDSKKSNGQDSEDSQMKTDDQGQPAAGNQDQPMEIPSASSSSSQAPSGSTKRRREAGDERDQDEGQVMDIMEVMCEEIDEEVNNDIEDYHEAEMEENMQKNFDWADMEDAEIEPEVVYDDLTGKLLKWEKVIKARFNEVEALIKMGVWEVVPLAMCLTRTQKRPIKGRWVDINKGDDIMETYRSRYVAREIRDQHGGAHREGLFAAMPPLEALKILISRTGRVGTTEHMRHKLMFMDISKAYLHADVADPDLYVELPKEIKQPGMCGHLLKALYGTREAAKCWEKEYTKTLIELGFRKGRTNPCIFRHRTKDMTVFVHGDDFVVSGTEDDMKQVQELFCEKYITKVRGIVGPDPSDMKAIVILNRILQWTEDGITLEADQRHVELILKQMEMEKCNGSEITGGAVKPESDGEKLNDVQGRNFRSMAARCNFMASDRVDLQFACKEICRRMSSPCDGDWSGLKQVARYLKAHPRMLMEFKYQKPVKELTVLVDTDYGGCKRTRWSTNGGIALLGKHLVKSWSTTQTVVSLSSGEAEYYGVAKGACEGVGIVGLIEDMSGTRAKIDIATDSSAAKGIATRRGVGKVKHLETRTLWVQDQVERGRLRVRKIDGEHNQADVLTKYLSGGRLSRLLENLPVRFAGGRHELAPQLQEIEA